MPPPPIFSRFLYAKVFLSIMPGCVCLVNTDEFAADQLVRDNQPIDQFAWDNVVITSARSGMKYSVDFYTGNNRGGNQVSCDGDALDCCLQASTALMIVARKHSVNSMPRSPPYFTYSGVLTFAHSLYCTG